MSYRYLPAEVGACSEASFSAGAQSATSSGSRSASKCSRRGSRTGSSMTRRSGMTSARSTGIPGLERWISLQRASLASRSAWRDTGAAKTTTATCGRPPCESFARYNRRSRCWRTYRGSGRKRTSASARFSETWPRAGMTHAGIAYRLPPLAPAMSGIGYGFWPTPVVMDATLRESVGKWLRRRKVWEARGDILHLRLPIAVELFPNARWLTEGRRWPTPTASDARRSPGDMTRRASLGAAVCRFQQRGGELNPRWVEWLQGWPIGWTDLKPLATVKFLRWLQLHGCYSLERQPVRTSV